MSIGTIKQIIGPAVDEENVAIIKSKHDFWTLSGSLKSKIKLNNVQLKRARKTFEKQMKIS